MGGDRFDAGHRLGFAGDLIDEMEADVAPWPLIGHHRRQRRQSPAGQLDRGRSVLLHAAENIGEPFLRPPGMPVGIEMVGTFREPGEQCALCELERIDGFSKIRSRRHLDAPGAAAEIDGIEIELENLPLAQLALDPRRHDHLADLALVGEIVADQQVLRDLLGDGRAALRAAGLGKVADEGADQAALVDPLVLIEALVLGRDEGFLHVLRNVGEGNPYPALILLEHFRERLACAVEHDARAGKLQALELGVIGQVGDRLVVEIDHRAEIDGRDSDGLVLAKLPIGGLQIDKIDAAECLALADGLRVVQRRRDEFLEVDVLDVEGLAHMGAACAQELRDLLLILRAIELGLHRLRCGRDLTERQRSGKDLSEDGFHGSGLAYSGFFQAKLTHWKVIGKGSVPVPPKVFRRRLACRMG